MLFNSFMIYYVWIRVVFTIIVIRWLWVWLFDSIVVSVLLCLIILCGLWGDLNFGAA